MQAIYLQKGEMCVGDVARPVCAPHELLIEVAAAGVNHADMLQVEGRYPPPECNPAVLGLEVAGSVMEVGEVAYAQGWRTGMRVCALLSEGGYARYAVADSGLALRLPDDYSLQHGAALPEALLTSWLALCDIGRLQAGHIVLIHGGASGLGVIAAQAARTIGATVLVTASSLDKRAFCARYGYKVLDCSTHTRLLQEAGEMVGKVDVVLDILGGAFVAANMKLLRKGGRLVSVACMAGSHADISVGAVLMKNIHWQGMTLRSLPVEEKIRLMGDMKGAWWQAVQNGDIIPHIHAAFPLNDVQKAHDMMRSRQHCGKIVLV
jgi:putative PIG3 family NAD(P)H quinone oxidoreductase